MSSNYRPATSRIMPPSASTDSIDAEFRAAAEAAGLSAKSVANYINRLGTLRTSVFPDISLRDVILGLGGAPTGTGPDKKGGGAKKKRGAAPPDKPPKKGGDSHIDAIDASFAVLRARYPTMSTRRNFLTAILAAIRYAPSLRDAPTAEAARARWSEFHSHARAFQEARYREHLPSERQMDRYVSFDDIEAKYHELKAQDAAATSLATSQELLLLSFVLSMPPKRADLGSVRIFTDADPRLKDDNYLVLMRADERRLTPAAYLVMNRYKTSAKYGRVETDVPSRATTDLVDSLRHWPREHLFVSVRNSRAGNMKPFASNNSFGQWVQSVFKKLFGRETGVTMLRHIFVTERLDTNATNEEEMDEIARHMLHSRALQRKYNWDKDKICESMCPCTKRTVATNTAVATKILKDGLAPKARRKSGSPKSRSHKPIPP